MKKFFFSLILLGAVFSAGIFIGIRQNKKTFACSTLKKLDIPVQQNREFVVVIRPSDNVKGIERALRSLEEQDYPYFRIIYLMPVTLEKNAKDNIFSLVNKYHLDEKFDFLQEEKEMLSFYQAVHHCKDEEIIVLLQNGEFFSHEGVLFNLNQYYQNPGLWLASCGSIIYPTFSIENPIGLSNYLKRDYRKKTGALPNFQTFYSGLFKKIKLSDFFFHNTILEEPLELSYVLPMLEMAENKSAHIPDILYIKNQKELSNDAQELIWKQARESYIRTLSSYPAVETLFSETVQAKVEVIIFSEDRPLPLFALLESLQKQMKGFYQVFVFYSTTAANEKSYEDVQDFFTGAHFIQENSSGFKQAILNTIFDSASDFVLFASDEFTLSSEIDIDECALALEKAKAYAFYFQKDENFKGEISLMDKIEAWHFEQDKKVYHLPHNLDMTLFYKNDLKKILEDSEYESPSMLAEVMAGVVPGNMIGLSYTDSKIVRTNIK